MGNVIRGERVSIKVGGLDVAALLSRPSIEIPRRPDNGEWCAPCRACGRNVQRRGHRESCLLQRPIGLRALFGLLPGEMPPPMRVEEIALERRLWAFNGLVMAAWLDDRFKDPLTLTHCSAWNLAESLRAYGYNRSATERRLMDEQGNPWGMRGVR